MSGTNSMSPLALQMLMSGGGGGGMPQDPAILAALPRLQLAQSMMQSSMNSAPTSKYGALAQALQGVIGGYTFNKGNEGIQQVLQQRAANNEKMLNEMSGSPDVSAGPVGGTPQAGGFAQPPVSPTSLSSATHQLESGGSMRPGITGDGGQAGGPMQVHQAALDDVNKAHGTSYTFADMTSNPAVGKWVGDQYLALQQQRFPGRPDLALAAYNAGPGATSAAVQSGAGVAGLPPSTQGYVAKGLQLAGAPGGGPGGAPPVGMQSPQVAHAIDMMQRAQKVINATAADPYNPANQGLRAAAQSQIELAKTMMGVGANSVVSSPYGPMDVNAATGVNKPLFGGRPTVTILPDKSYVTTYPDGRSEHTAAPSAGALGESQIPQAKVEIWKNMAARDMETVQEDQKAASQNSNVMNTTAAIRALQPDVKTGMGADARLWVSQFGAALGIPEDKMKAVVGTNPVQGELLQKQLFGLATAAERKAMGARGAGTVLNQFTQMYPNLSSRDLTIDGMTRLVDMDQLRAQDNASEKQSFLNNAVNNIDTKKGYTGLAGFDAEFNKTHPARVYAAAALAAGGLPYKAWTIGLSPEQITQAAQLAGHTYSDARILGPDGQVHVMTPQLPGGSGG